MSKSIEYYKDKPHRYHVEGNTVYIKEYIGTNATAKRLSSTAKKDGTLVRSKHGNFIKKLLFKV